MMTIVKPGARATAQPVRFSGQCRMPSPPVHSTTQNHRLAAFPAAEYDRLAPHLELVPMPLGQVLCESGAQLNHVYFPTTAIISMLYVLEDGASAEIAVVGNEGILGISIFMMVKAAHEETKATASRVEAVFSR